MQTPVKFIDALALILVTSFIFVPLCSLLGACSGWVVGLFFENTILDVLKKVGVADVSLWQMGATLGFIGSFLRTKVIAEVSSKDLQEAP